MKKDIRSSIIAAALMSVVGLSHAGPTPVIATDVTQNRGYIGMVWTLEKSSIVPDVVAVSYTHLTLPTICSV